MTAPPRAARRRQARRRALELLYAADVVRRDLRAEVARLLDDPHAERPDAFAEELVRGVSQRLAEVDALISRHARGWSLGRMPVIDRNLLRIATYELAFAATPPAVAIAEAVELAKSLSTGDSSRYVNGVLSAIMRAEGVPDVGAEAPTAVGSPPEPLPASRDEAQEDTDGDDTRP